VYSILRVASEMKTNTQIRCKNAVSTVRKSQANVVAACWRRKTRHDKPLRSGAGGIPALIRTLRTVVAEIATPRPFRSPTILRYPQRARYRR